MKMILNIVTALGIILLLTAVMVDTEVSELQPGQKAQIYILLNFDGDPDFPSITWQHETYDLKPFTGTILGLPIFELENLKEHITNLVKEDYSEFNNIHIVTSKDEIVEHRTLTSEDEDELTFWYTWGIDDKTYVFSIDDNMNDDNEPEYPSPILRGLACPETEIHRCGRLYGKAGAYKNPNEKNQFGNSIYHPLFARTFAGSFSIPPDGASPSNPPLIYGESYAGMGLPNINVEQLAQAIANSASHEIAHLFRLNHPMNCGAECTSDLMNTEEEWKMARYNMGFLYPNGLEKLRKTVRIASTADQLEPNNSIATASIIEDQQLDLTLHNPFDEDFIKYIVPSTSEKSIKITITHDFSIDD